MRSLSSIVGLGLLFGVLVGGALHHWANPAVLDLSLRGFALCSDIFLQLIRMVIGPLVFATLVGGMAKVGQSGAKLRRPILLSIGWFFLWSVIALATGTLLALWLSPGSGMAVKATAAAAPSMAKLQGPEAIILHAFPASIFAAFAENNILQVVVFALFVGSAIASLGERSEGLLRAINQLEAVMLAITRRVMLMAPFAAFAAVAGVTGKSGLEVILPFGRLVLDFYLALLLLSALLLLTLWAFERASLPILLRRIRTPALLAFSTSSSEVAYPNLIEALERHGLPRRIVGLVLPLGYSFNLDASMMYCAFGSLFIAQAYGIVLSPTDLIGLMAMLLVASKGIAAVPRGALVAITAVAPHFGIPEAGVAMLLAVDHLMNMGRSLVNVLGNTVATVAVARLAGQQPPALDAGDANGR